MSEKEKTIEAESPPFRPGTRIASTKVALVFNAGGIGDYIHWIGAIKYVIHSNPHIEGLILAPGYFLDLAKLWLDNFSSRFTVRECENLNETEIFSEYAGILPNNKQLINACGFHLTHLGFYYFTQRDKVPEGYKTLPTITGEEADLTHFNLPKDYAVIPTEATSENRMLSAEVINSITKHLLSRGITPIFLGRKNLAPDYFAKSSPGISTKGVLDLREKTSLREAACIMAKARFTLGMDGGLLHLASCSLAPVIFIFTTVHPSYRIPYRRDGADTFIVTPPKELHCRFCNTGEPKGKSMTYVIGHDFKNCLYGDNLCTKLIDSKTLIPVIDQILERK